MYDTPPSPKPAISQLLSAQGRPASTLIPLYFGFLATGVGVALPGAILPVLLTRWRLQDSGGGTLFLLAFAGSSLGALLISGSLIRSIALGSLTIALAVLGLSVVPVGPAFLCMFLFGVGLGSTMTAISLLVQQQSEDSGRAMVRLNLLWAFGASFCPILALHTLRSGDPRTLLVPLGLCFGALALWVMPGRGRGVLAGPALPETIIQRSFRSRHPARNFLQFCRSVPLNLIVLIMLATGVEASAGGWLATYAKRGGDPISGIVAAPTCLWAGLLLSRLCWSIAPRLRHERLIILASLLLTTASATTLLASRHRPFFFLAALCLGFGAGPVYPLLLARSLRFHSGGIIFFLAGAGAALLPWLMGLVSTWTRSLHTGFYVTAAATVIMVLLAFRIPKEHPRSS